MASFKLSENIEFICKKINVSICYSHTLEHENYSQLYPSNVRKYGRLKTATPAGGAQEGHTSVFILSFPS